MTTEVIWDGKHSLHNLTEEEKRNLPHSIHGICACGAGFTLQPKIGVFEQNTAWYVCNVCGYQISLYWQHEEERFKAVRGILEAIASGTSELATIVKKPSDYSLMPKEQALCVTLTSVEKRMSKQFRSTWGWCTMRSSCMGNY